MYAAWTGDPMCDWSNDSGLPAQVNAMLTASMSGVPFIGSDIGGFVWIEPPSLELWVRWSQVSSGCLGRTGNGALRPFFCPFALPSLSAGPC